MKHFLIIMFALFQAGCAPINHTQANQERQQNIQAKEQKKESKKLDLPTDLHAYAGLPNQDGYTILKNKAFTVGYWEKSRQPKWVCYRVPGLVKFKSGAGKGHAWMADERTTARVQSKGFTRSGFYRGQMAPYRVIYERFGAEAGKETFYMSNVAPQHPNLKEGAWKKLEDLVADNWSKKYQGVWIITGPAMIEHSKPVKGLKSRKSKDPYYVFYCFKIILDIKNGKPRALAFLLPNNEKIKKNADLKKYIVSIDKIENITDLYFFRELPDDLEKKLEAETASKLW